MNASTLRRTADNHALLEVGRKAIEELLVSCRDNRISEIGRGNGCVIREADGKDSHVIRFGPETAVRVALNAMADYLEANTVKPEPDGTKADTV